MPFITIEVDEQQEAKIADLISRGQDFRIDGGQVGGHELKAIEVRFERSAPGLADERYDPTKHKMIDDERFVRWTDVRGGK